MHFIEIVADPGLPLRRELGSRIFNEQGALAGSSPLHVALPVSDHHWGVMVLNPPESKNFF